MTKLPAAVPQATIVMYHIVQSSHGLAAALKGISIESFRGQLQYIRAHYNPVGISDLVDAAHGVAVLPPRPIVLTFDDGYAGHYHLAFPLLRETATPATFFPVASSLLDRLVLDVNKIQLVLAGCPDVDAIVTELESAIDRDAASGKRSTAEYRAQWWTASRWDPPAVVYAKRLLQHALPDHLRVPLLDDLFHRFVSTDQAAVAGELYMTAQQAQEMRQHGMTVGAHADRHLRLPTLSPAAQAAEIDGALRVLDAAGAERQPFVFAYANGEYTADSIALLGERGCCAAVTTHPELASVDRNALLTLPRIDTNHLPVTANAAANEWTRRAGERPSKV